MTVVDIFIGTVGYAIDLVVAAVRDGGTCIALRVASQARQTGKIGCPSGEPSLSGREPATLSSSVRPSKHAGGPTTWRSRLWMGTSSNRKGQTKIRVSSDDA